MDLSLHRQGGERTGGGGGGRHLLLWQKEGGRGERKGNSIFTLTSTEPFTSCWREKETCVDQRGVEVDLSLRRKAGERTGGGVGGGGEHLLPLPPQKKRKEKLM